MMINRREHKSELTVPPTNPVRLRTLRIVLIAVTGTAVLWSVLHLEGNIDHDVFCLIDVMSAVAIAIIVPMPSWCRVRPQSRPEKGPPWVPISWLLIPFVIVMFALAAFSIGKAIDLLQLVPVIVVSPVFLFVLLQLLVTVFLLTIVETLRVVDLRIADGRLQLTLAGGLELDIPLRQHVRAVYRHAFLAHLSGLVMADGTRARIDRSQRSRLHERESELFTWLLGESGTVRGVYGGPTGEVHVGIGRFGAFVVVAAPMLVAGALVWQAWGAATILHVNLWTARAVLALTGYFLLHTVVVLLARRDLDTGYVITDDEILRMRRLKIKGRLRWADIVEYSPTPPWTRFPLNHFSRHWGSKTLRSSTGDRMRVVRVMRFDELDREIHERISPASG